MKNILAIAIAVSVALASSASLAAGDRSSALRKNAAHAAVAVKPAQQPTAAARVYDSNASINVRPSVPGYPPAQPAQ